MPRSAMEQYNIDFDRRMIVTTANVLSTGGTYCFTHGLVMEHCSQCHSFPDLSPYYGRAKALMEAQQFRRRGKHEGRPAA